MNVGKMAGMAVVALLLAAGALQAGITIETVRVGNPGNAADKRYDANGFGSVSYIYNIGKYEVTAGQYTAFLNAVAKTDTYGLYNTNMDTPYSAGCNIKRTGSSGSYSYTVDSNWGNRPVNYVSWGDAARFANWLHNGQKPGAQDISTTEDGAYYLNGATDTQQLAVTRKSDWRWAITSEDEWYKAAYYKGGSTNAGYWAYPTGSDTAPSNVGSDGYTDPGNHANFYTNEGYTIGSPYYRTNVGEFENSASPYGTFDQGGNVREWNEGLFSSCRGLRGGSFDHILDHLQASNRYCTDPTLEYYTIGFRVSEVPEPASMAVLALGGIGMLIGRRGLVKGAEE